MIKIIEQTVVAKSPNRKSEDGIVVAPDFVAVIDGSTSKTNLRYSLIRSNGRYAMQLIGRIISRMPKQSSLDQFLTLATTALRCHYKRKNLPRLALHPEERLTASAIVYSRLRREIWMIGDCQCLIDGTLFTNPKAYEQTLAQHRAALIRQLSPEEQKKLTIRDTARETIIPEMIAAMQGQNKTYAVIDGFPVYRQGVRVLTLDFQPHQLVLASDGYPFLCHTLEESEARLRQQLNADPLNIQTFNATKGLLQGNNSFDDRAYIRFEV